MPSPLGATLALSLALPLSPLPALAQAFPIAAPQGRHAERSGLRPGLKPFEPNRGLSLAAGIGKGGR